jgi:DNA-binding MarR family transcriptional regulator
MASRRGPSGQNDVPGEERPATPDPAGDADPGRPTDPGRDAELDAALSRHSTGASPGFLLWHATLRWQREATAALRAVDLTHVQFLVLTTTWWLGRLGDPPNQRELAQHAGLDQVMTSQVVRVLERAGLIGRERDPHDARVMRLAVTPAGRDLARRSVVLLDRVDAEFFRGAEDASAAGGFLAALRGLAGQRPSGRPRPDQGR